MTHLEYDLSGLEKGGGREGGGREEGRDRKGGFLGCSGWNCIPPKDEFKAQSLVPVTVTLLGNRAFEVQTI